MNQIEPTGKTKLLGLLGWPVSHSKSPRMQTAAARAAGLDYLYVPLPVHPVAVADAVRGLPALGFAGVNVTVPHKEAVIPFLDDLDPAAQALGAVNTITIEPADQDAGYRPRLKGYNTDAAGFARDLHSWRVEVSGRPCLVLGAGGSARAVAYALAQAGAEVHVLARRPAQRQALLEQLAPHLPAGSLHDHHLNAAPGLAARFPDAVVINTTPLGMAPRVERSIWAADWPLPAGGFVYDLVYNPANTKLMEQARAAGRPAANGLGMLLHQGAEAFFLWTGVRPDLKVMREALATG